MARGSRSEGGPGGAVGRGAAGYHKAWYGPGALHRQHRPGGLQGRESEENRP